MYKTELDYVYKVINEDLPQVNKLKSALETLSDAYQTAMTLLQSKIPANITPRICNEAFNKMLIALGHTGYLASYVLKDVTFEQNEIESDTYNKFEAITSKLKEVLLMIEMDHVQIRNKHITHLEGLAKQIANNDIDVQNFIRRANIGIKQRIDSVNAQYTGPERPIKDIPVVEEVEDIVTGTREKPLVIEQAEQAFLHLQNAVRHTRMTHRERYPFMYPADPTPATHVEVEYSEDHSEHKHHPNSKKVTITNELIRKVRDRLEEEYLESRGPEFIIRAMYNMVRTGYFYLEDLKGLRLDHLILTYGKNKRDPKEVISLAQYTPEQLEEYEALHQAYLVKIENIISKMSPKEQEYRRKLKEYNNERYQQQIKEYNDEMSSPNTESLEVDEEETVQEEDDIIDIEEVTVAEVQEEDGTILEETSIPTRPIE